MNNYSRHFIVAVLALLPLGLIGPAFAQYVWIDSSNVRHYSDMPPPSSVPESHILKTPRGRMMSGPVYEPKSSGSADARKADSTVNPVKTPMSLAEKNADFQKRRMEQAEKEKKAEEAEIRAAEKQKNCERAMGYKRTLESGRRISYDDKKGERVFMDDKERARELEDVNRRLESCK